MKKQIPIVLTLGGIFLTQSVSASMIAVGPSLYDQMQRQSVIDQQNQLDMISRHNDEQLRIIRERNQARMNAKQQKKHIEESKTTQHIPLFSATAFSNNRTPKKTNSTEKHSTPQIQVASHIVTHTDKSSNSTPITTTAQELPANVDMNRIADTWIGWNNSLRNELWLTPYTRDIQLDATAQEWANFSRNRGYVMHGRPWDGCIGETNYGCYNFKAIDNWFKERGINPIIIGRAKHTENLGIGSFRCTKSDCTDDVIKAIRKTYDFFYSEKSYNGSHWRSLVSPAFKKIGVGLAHKNGQYYLVIHYITDYR